MNLLRKYIRQILIQEACHGICSLSTARSVEDQQKPDDNLLLEPDEVEDSNDTAEVSTVANIAGVSTPLGTGPTYPIKAKKKRKNPADIAGGGYKRYSFPKKKKK